MQVPKKDRKFSRVNFKIVANVKTGDKEFEGAIRNLSMGGLYLLTDEKLAVGDEAGISIALDDQPENGLEIDVRVARVTDDGIAFAFDKIDFDSYIHLKNLIALNTGDVQKLQDEMVSFLIDSHTQSSE
ncbi:MAG: PilZ domain-containing protein [Holophagaceae bacterium]|nr:PilZ domain-containing protein [Holophagaceae bacterium]